MKKEKLYSEYLMKYERYMNQYSRMEELKKRLAGENLKI